MDQSLVTGRLDASLPFIKQQAVTVLTANYTSTEQAMEGIATELDKFYLTKYPDLHKNKQAAIRNAIAEVQRIFKSTTFPEMKLDWKTHPNNIGHFYFPGCFRCHDGQHVSPEGLVIRKDCDICHTILAQEEGSAMMNHTQGVQFQHPVDLGDITAVSCNDCHTGGVGP